MASAKPSKGLDEFLKPLHIDSRIALELSRDLAATFRRLSAESLIQFLPTPISESLLRGAKDHVGGRFLAIDIGGTNLRVGFVELLGTGNEPATPNGLPNGTTTITQTYTEGPRLRRLLERSWPIEEHLKNENPERLFAWIGENIAAVVRDGVTAFSLPSTETLPMGVAFSFPMDQRTLSDAKLTAMGKGFAITSGLDLGALLLEGYAHASGAAGLPPIRVAAFVNDAIATFVSFSYQFPAGGHQKAVMGLICGTGTNATLPLRLSTLHESKRPASVRVLPGDDAGEHVKIAVNTEWSIKGTAPPMQKLGLLSRWDEELGVATEIPGFQPLEYMAAGRYLGELGRIIFVDYATRVLNLDAGILPAKFRERYAVTTTFLSDLRPASSRGPMLEQLDREFPTDNLPGFSWTEELADALYRIAQAIELRAAGIIAAAVVGLLVCADEIPAPGSESEANARDGPVTELVVGYTGGCIVHFQDYVADCQKFLDGILDDEFKGAPPLKVVLSPCHDGGITGAGILVPAALAGQEA